MVGERGVDWKETNTIHRNTNKMSDQRVEQKHQYGAKEIAEFVSEWTLDPNGMLEMADLIHTHETGQKRSCIVDMGMKNMFLTKNASRHHNGCG